tara:strand:- start:1268 stop:1594 length:327 start_codon:yes stop_codon:yes gene_type:complete
MEELCENMAEMPADMEQQEKQALYRTYNALDLCINGGEIFTRNFCHEIEGNFKVYIENIDFREGPDHSATAKAFIDFFMEEQDIEKKARWAWKAYEYIIKSIETVLIS